MLKLSISTSGQYIVLYKQLVILRTSSQKKAEKFMLDNENRKLETIEDIQEFQEYGKRKSDMMVWDCVLFNIDLSKKCGHYTPPNNHNHGYVFRTTSGALR